jgi:hypothetical protein
MHRLRVLSTAALLALLLDSSAVAAQQLVTFGSLEASGFGQSVALLGASLGTGREGWSPVGTLMGYTIRYKDVTGADVTQNTIAPALGVRYQVPGQNWQLQVGRSFTNNDVSGNVIGLPAESQEGTFTSGEWNYWGQGERVSSAIVNYNWDAEYLWARARSGWRVGLSPMLVGGEVIAQGTTADPGPAAGSRFEFRAGPTVMFRLTPNFRVDATAGLRTNSGFDRQSGYARADFTWVLDFNRR